MWGTHPWQVIGTRLKQQPAQRIASGLSQPIVAANHPLTAPKW